MRRFFALLSGTALLGAGAAFLPLEPVSQPSTAQVTVHCSAGDRGGFVTPDPVRIRPGDNVEWRMAANVLSDSIILTPKQDFAWPFEGPPPRSGGPARANNAGNAGQYRYNVTLYCRTPGGEAVREDIDPDIIIGG